jgi:hypothetical protein
MLLRVCKHDALRLKMTPVRCTEDGFEGWDVGNDCIVFKVWTWTHSCHNTILEEEEDNDLLIYCISDSATDIFKKRKDEGYYTSLIGKYLMDSEMK